MDANGLRFWMLAEPRHWPARAHAVWDAGCRTLQLASERGLPAHPDFSVAFAEANSALERVPRAVDPVDAVAYWDEEANAIVVKSYLPGTALVLPLNDRPSDLCVGADAVLYVALPDGVLMHDLRGRWADVLVAPTDAPGGGFAPWRLAAAYPDGVWVLDRQSGRLARLEGRPMPAQTPQADDYAPGVFRPDPENCRVPALRVLADPAWPAGERPVALAAHAESGLALLSWDSGNHATLRRWDAVGQRLEPAVRLNGARLAYALAWIDGGRIAVRVPGCPDAPAYSWDFGNVVGTRDPLGEVYPIAADGIEAPFAHRVTGPPRYPAGENDARPLRALSLTNLARLGTAANYVEGGGELAAQLIDSGSTTTTWHRLFAEASIPANSGFTVWLAATNEARPPELDDTLMWHPHGFGRDIAALDAALVAPHLPRASWEHSPSELPGHRGLGPWEPEAGSRGLFSVLIQNARRRVRTLRGRYLWVRVTLFGDGRVGPQIAALRAYGSRFSYVDQYLPRIYRETLFGDPAQEPGAMIDRIDSPYKVALDNAGVHAAITDSALQARLRQAIPDLGGAAAVTVEQPGESWLLRDPGGFRTWRLARDHTGDIGVFRPEASPADFLERMLANFEGVLTQIEDRVGSAHLFSDPDATPEPQLDWLASWLGVAFDPALPAARRRAWLSSAEALARWHGTKRGLQLALNIATGDAVRRGGIVVVEDFRLRRILATLLGVDLGDELDPLLPGLVQSANSVVGDTLLLGDRERVELLALFREEVATAAENEAVLGFLGRLAHRATVLVHQDVEPQDLGLIRRIVELESPAHVEVRVATATWPLMVGVYSLVGVDTYLGMPRAAQPVRLNRSGLGGGDYLVGPAVLDPRMRGAATPSPASRPIADAGEDTTESFGHSFELDGGASRAAEGRKLAKYVWRRLPPEIT